MSLSRLSTLSKATKIVVVDNGRIIECGTPEALMAQKGYFHALYTVSQ